MHTSFARLRHTLLSMATMGVLGLAQPAGADTFSVIHNVSSPIAGANEVRFPNLVFGSDGALYGISYFDYGSEKGGYSVHAELFRLAPPASGQTKWSYSTLYDFDNDPYGISDGPIGLVTDRAGSLYTMYPNGRYDISGPEPAPGFIVKLARPASGVGPWIRTLVHQFGTDAGSPQFIEFGGTATLLGTDGYEIYQLSPPPAGQTNWHFSVVYEQPDTSSTLPFRGFVRAIDGSLFGSSYEFPGSSSIWRLTLPAPGQSAPSFQVLDRFNGTRPIGYNPGVPTVDRSLRVYDWNTGSPIGSDVGTVLRLSPPAVGQTKWSESLLYAFQGTTDSGSPNAQLEAPDGKVYGVATCKGYYDHPTSCPGIFSTSGPPGTVGTLYRVTPPDYGGHQVPWHHVTLHTFNNPDGASPEVLVNGTLPDGRFALFGVTTEGGAYGFGTVFEYVP